MRVVVGRVGRAHGIRGEVAVEVRTDEPDARFADGATLLVADDRPPGHLTVAATRWHSGRLLVRFEHVDDRTAAESLRGRLLEVDVDPQLAPDEPDTYYDRQLVGLRAVGPDGYPFGVVTHVVHLPGQDLLEVRPASDASSGDEPVLVPFVTAIVPLVDLPGGRVVLTPPPGLFGEHPDASVGSGIRPADAPSCAEGLGPAEASESARPHAAEVPGRGEGLGLAEAPESARPDAVEAPGRGEVPGPAEPPAPVDASDHQGDRSGD